MQYRICTMEVADVNQFWFDDYDGKIKLALNDQNICKILWLDWFYGCEFFLKSVIEIDDRKLEY